MIHVRSAGSPAPLPTILSSPRTASGKMDTVLRLRVGAMTQRMSPEAVRERGLERELVVRRLAILEETLGTRDASLLLLEKSGRRFETLPEGVAKQRLALRSSVRPPVEMRATRGEVKRTSSML